MSAVNPGGPVNPTDSDTPPPRTPMPWIDSATAYANVKSAANVWSVPGKGLYSEDVSPENGGARMFGDLTTGLKTKRKFAVEPAMNVFTIGSCFARNIEVALLERKFAVATRISGFNYPHGYLNRYNTPSMRQEVALGLGEATFAPESIVSLPGGFADLTSNGLFPTREAVLAYRAATTALFAKIVAADLVIVTAGLSEVWYDHAFSQYLNVAPNNAARTEPKRFEMRLLDYQANASALHGLVKLIHARVPQARILMTVSPVPLNGTFMDRDVIISNTYSKSCLRAAVEEIYWSYDFVDYFPSYEMVVHSDDALVWENDRRHVKAAFVDKIMQAFVNAYIDA